MRFLSLLLVLITLISCKKEQQKPTLINQAVVQDYSNLFSITEKDSISKVIIDYEKKSTNQICVYIIDSIPSINTPVVYAAKIANNLGVGHKKKDNGLLLLISKNDRQIAIATGYGTEKTITDSICKRLLDFTLAPSFKKKHYFEGVLQVLDSIKTKWSKSY